MEEYKTAAADHGPNIWALECLEAMQHAKLVQLGVRWLSRQCSVVLYEAAVVKKEIPDVIGWVGPRAVLIECKASRADFLRDAAKVTRTDPKAGMAQRRYYLCPARVVQLRDLPPKWGLLWAEKGRITVQREARGFPQRNLLAEVEFLSTMLRRAQIRVGTRPLSEWLRGESRFEAQRGIPPNSRSKSAPIASTDQRPPRSAPTPVRPQARRIG
jgi:hypothetical protein